MPTVTLKLTVTEYNALNDLVAWRNYASRSGAIRAAIGLLFDQHKIKKGVDGAIERERRKAKPRISSLKNKLQARTRFYQDGEKQTDQPFLK